MVRVGLMFTGDFSNLPAQSLLIQLCIFVCFYFIILVVTRVVKDPDEVTEDYMTLKKIASIYSCILLGRGVFHKGHR